jgi:hypothetical protein
MLDPSNWNVKSDEDTLIKAKKIRINVTSKKGGYQILKRYIVYFYNRFAQQSQRFKVIAKNEYRAGRLFYLKHDRKSYKSCIEYIIEADTEKFWTEEEILTAIKQK